MELLSTESIVSSDDANISLIKYKAHNLEHNLSNSFCFSLSKSTLRKSNFFNEYDIGKDLSNSKNKLNILETS